MFVFVQLSKRLSAQKQLVYFLVTSEVSHRIISNRKCQTYHNTLETPTRSVLDIMLTIIDCILDRVHDFRLPNLVTVTIHISLNFGSITGSNEDSCLRCQLVFICSHLNEFDETMSIQQADLWWCVSVLFGGYVWSLSQHMGSPR